MELSSNSIKKLSKKAGIMALFFILFNSCNIQIIKKNELVIKKGFKQNILFLVNYTKYDLLKGDTSVKKFYVKFFDDVLDNYYFQDEKNEVLIHSKHNFDMKKQIYFTKDSPVFQQVNWFVNHLRISIPHEKYKWEKSYVDDNCEFYLRNHKYSNDTLRWCNLEDTINIENIFWSKYSFDHEKIRITIYPKINSENLNVKSKELSTFNKTAEKTLIKKNLDCDTILPLKDLENYYPTNNLEKLIVLYGFIGCPPCQKINIELMKMVNENKLNPERIKIINVIDTKEDIDNYLRKSGILFEKMPLEVNCNNFSFPKTAAYLNGKLIWSVDGYNSKLIKKINSFLND